MLSVSIRVLSFESVIVFLVNGLAGHFAGVEHEAQPQGKSILKLGGIGNPTR